MRPIPEMDRTLETAVACLPATFHIEELKEPPRLVWEASGTQRAFEKRAKISDGEYTHERAKQAFEDYKFYRDLADRRAKVMQLSRKLTEARMKDRPHDVKDIERALRANEVEYNPKGGEAIYNCANFEEAQARVMELIGPIETERRHYRYARLGDYKDTGSNGTSGPINGFEASVNFGHNGTAQQFSRSWRIDYDPVKGSHFNVIIRPGAPMAGGYLNQCDPESLKLALIFPGDEASYKGHLRDVEISAITSFARDDTAGHSLDYFSNNG